jgi:hypothetical protein
LHLLPTKETLSFLYIKITKAKFMLPEAAALLEGLNIELVDSV